MMDTTAACRCRRRFGVGNGMEHGINMAGNKDTAGRLIWREREMKLKIKIWREKKIRRAVRNMAGKFVRYVGCACT